jgi:hypothetical protein
MGDDTYVLADYVFVDEHNRHKRLKGKAFCPGNICHILAYLTKVSDASL